MFLSLGGNRKSSREMIKAAVRDINRSGCRGLLRGSVMVDRKAGSDAEELGVSSVAREVL